MPGAGDAGNFDRTHGNTGSRPWDATCGHGSCPSTRPGGHGRAVPSSPPRTAGAPACGRPGPSRGGGRAPRWGACIPGSGGGRRRRSGTAVPPCPRRPPAGAGAAQRAARRSPAPGPGPGSRPACRRPPRSGRSPPAPAEGSEDAVAPGRPGMPRQAPTLYDPFAVLQSRCPRTVFASPVRLSSGKSATVSWMPAIRRRFTRRPGKVVDLRFVIRGSMARLPEIRGQHANHGRRVRGVREKIRPTRKSRAPSTGCATENVTRQTTGLSECH